MVDIKEVFIQSFTSEVYHINTCKSLTSIKKLAEDNGLLFYYIDGMKATNKDTFFEITKEVFNFPENTGLNWDAFFDRLRGIPWEDEPLSISAKGSVILYDHFEILAQNDIESFILIYGCFWEAFDFKWKKYGYPIYLILCGDKGVLPDDLITITITDN
jgi:hypothetical protein